MTKKHFEAIAKLLNEASVRESKSGPCVKSPALQLCSLSQSENLRFDRGRFLGACGF